MMRSLRFEPDTTMPELCVHSELSTLNKTGTWRGVRPIYQTTLAPCRQSCPASENIPAYFDLVKHGHLAEAWEMIRRDNPFPAVCGRVCYHPCEDGCNRHQFDEGLSINAIERLVGDFGLSLPHTKRQATTSAGTVAVVGSGPAGLSCAYYLASIDYSVTVYEAASTPGGMLALGIPEYRLPRDILRAEIALIEASGVNIVTNTAVGTQLSISQLFEQGSQAVFLAIGAHQATAPTLDGEECGDVIKAIDFLRQVNSPDRPKVGQRVAVVGGGNVAIDAARSALRLGASEVTILYRRSREQMPAHTSEITAAEAEGIRFHYLVTPIGVVKNGRVEGFRCRRMELGNTDRSGRRSVTPIAGTDFVFQADTLIMATGQRPASECFVNDELRLNLDGTIATDATTLATSRTGVFAGGDAVTGAARVVDAIAAGKRAAQSIHRFITGQPEPTTQESPPVVSFENLNLDYFQHQARVKPNGQGKADGDSSKEAGGLSMDEALREIERCFSCGTCNGCDNCWLFCPDVAISRQGHDYHIDYDYCKGCGICATECPRSAIRVEEEAK